MSIKDFDFAEILQDTPSIQEFLKEKNRKKISSPKPLEFTPNEDDSPIKSRIIEIINSRNLTYSDLYDFCTARNETGDIEQGRVAAQNYILGLRDRPKMYDKTVSDLCEFLKIKIVLEERSEKEEYPEELLEKVPVSSKPLQFEISEKASPVKKLIVEKINEKNLVYRDLYAYCMFQNPEHGKDDAINLINGIRKRDSMYDTTFCVLADFLNCNILIEEEENGEN